jgi:hypothetical protein
MFLICNYGIYGAFGIVVDRSFCPEFDEDLMLEPSWDADTVIFEVYHQPSVSHRDQPYPSRQVGLL